MRFLFVFFPHFFFSLFRLLSSGLRVSLCPSILRLRHFSFGSFFPFIADKHKSHENGVSCYGQPTPSIRSIVNLLIRLFFSRYFYFSRNHVRTVGLGHRTLVFCSVASPSDTSWMTRCASEKERITQANTIYLYAYYCLLLFLNVDSYLVSDDLRYSANEKEKRLRCMYSI